MLREKLNWTTQKSESTDAGHRGGTLCSSDEAAVMAVERRKRVVQRKHVGQPQWEEPMSQAKPFEINKHDVFNAWRQVKANRGAHGIDEQTITEYEGSLKIIFLIFLNFGIECRLAIMFHPLLEGKKYSSEMKRCVY